MTTRELVVTRMSHDEAQQYGNTFAKSRLFTLKETPVDVVPFKLAAIVMAGAELGFAPFTSIAGISIVEGKPRLGYQLMGALVRRSGRYDYRVLELNNERASVEFVERDLDGEKPTWRTLGVSTFTLDDAKAAELYPKKDNWRKYPKSMLFARALTQGVNFFCPDAAAGCPVYSEDEEFGAREVEGRAVSLAAAVAPPEKQKPAQLAQTAAPSAPNPELSTPKQICEAATANGAPPSKTLEVPAETSIVRPDGTTTKLDHASAAIENAKLDDAKAAKPPRKPRASKKEQSEAVVASQVAGGGSSVSTQAAASTVTPPATVASTESSATSAPPTAVVAAKPEDPKVDVGHASPAEIAAAEKRADDLATAMGVKPGDSQLAPTAPAQTTTAPAQPAKQSPPAQESAPAKKHPGLAAYELQCEIADMKLDAEKPVEGKLAARAHVCGVNWYGTDAAARAAWQAVNYSLPKKGDKVTTMPTPTQIDGYLATIVAKAEEKERGDEASSLFGDETSDL